VLLLVSANIPAAACGIDLAAAKIPYQQRIAVPNHSRKV
jgi:hypothetical protein